MESNLRKFFSASCSDRSSVDHDGRPVEAAHSNQAAGHVLVTPGDSNQGVIPLGLKLCSDELQTRYLRGEVGNKFSKITCPPMMVSILSAMTSLDCKEKLMPSVPIEMPSLTPIVLNRNPVRPASLTPSEFYIRPDNRKP